MATHIAVLPRGERLTANYPNAYRDFYRAGAPCVFKSGPDWPTRRWNWNIVREARPVYRHAIGSTWLSIGKLIYLRLDSLGVNWTSINPLAYAEAEEAKPFCPLIISIGVKPHSLLYDAAVTAAKAVKQILTEADFPDIEVAFVESVVTRSVAAKPKLLTFDPIIDDATELRKPFTSVLGISIAPLEYPHLEGTAALYFRLGKDDKRVAILTCAHVARPLSVYSNTEMAYADKAHEAFVALGSMGYNNAVKDVVRTMNNLLSDIKYWKYERDREEHLDEERSSERQIAYMQRVESARRKAERLNALHDEVTKHHTTFEQRALGFVLHSEKIEITSEPDTFTNDWALIQLYDEKID